MRINWKFLCRLGFLFWSAMCILEYSCGSILNNGEFNKLPIIAIEEKPNMLEMERNKRVPLAETGLQWANTLLWFSILSSLFGFLIVRFTNKFFQRQIDPNCTNVETPTQMVDVQDQSLNVNLDDSHDSITVITPNAILKAPPFKDNSQSFGKRMEIMSEERKNLIKHLHFSERENRLIKEKLVNFLKEKNVLLKRLEVATREIKNNSVTRQATLEKLEESLKFSNMLKEQVQYLCKDNEVLQERVSHLEKKLKSLKKRQMSESSDLSDDNQKEKSSKITNCDEIEHIESKLHDLEKSLEKMRVMPKSAATADENPRGNQTSHDQTKSDTDVDLPSNDELENAEDIANNHQQRIRLAKNISDTDLSYNVHLEPSASNLSIQPHNQPNIQNQQQLFQKVFDSLPPTISHGIMNGRSHGDQLAVMNVFRNSLLDMMCKLDSSPRPSIIAAPLHKTRECLQLCETESTSSRNSSLNESSLAYDEVVIGDAGPIMPQKGRLSQSPAFQDLLQRLLEVKQ